MNHRIKKSSDAIGYSYFLLLAFMSMQVDAQVPPPDHIKSLPLGITIWRNEHYDQQRWACMVNLMRTLEIEPFNEVLLIETIRKQIAISKTKDGTGEWGSLMVTYLKDSQKINEQKQLKDIT